MGSRLKNHRRRGNGGRKQVRSIVLVAVALIVLLRSCLQGLPTEGDRKPPSRGTEGLAKPLEHLIQELAEDMGMVRADGGTKSAARDVVKKLGSDLFGDGRASAEKREGPRPKEVAGQVALAPDDRKHLTQIIGDFYRLAFGNAPPEREDDLLNDQSIPRKLERLYREGKFNSTGLLDPKSNEQRRVVDALRGIDRTDFRRIISNLRN